MQEIQELGLKKAFRFVIYTFWQVVYECMILPPMRTWWLRLWGARIGSGTVIQHVRFINVHHAGLGHFSAGKRCFVSDNVSFDLAGSVVLEDEAQIGEGSIFSTHMKIGYGDHPLRTYFPPKKGEIRIKKGAFIGAASIILSGVTVGEYSLIGAGSIITRDIPAWTLVQTNQPQIQVKIRRK